CIGRAQRLEAGRMERDRKTALRRRLPEGIPLVGVEWGGHTLECKVAAAQAQLGAAPNLSGCLDGVGVGNDRERVYPLRIGPLGEVGDPIIVSFVGPSS